jgi:LDH2 family malate/lactate/ureidoglycolate dehydrogenase
MGLGGARLGHRGFALGLLVEAMATVFAGEDTEDPSRIGNNVTVLAASVDREFAERADRMARYVVSSAPRGSEPVMLPGGIEQRRRSQAEMVHVERSVWEGIGQRAAARGLTVRQVL